MHNPPEKTKVYSRKHHRLTNLKLIFKRHDVPYRVLAKQLGKSISVISGTLNGHCCGVHTVRDLFKIAAELEKERSISSQGGALR